jgi:hypothetical protein
LVHVAGLKENKLPRNCLAYLLIILFQRIKFPNEWVKEELNDPENLAEWRVGDESEFLEDFKRGFLRKLSRSFICIQSKNVKKQLD